MGDLLLFIPRSGRAGAITPRLDRNPVRKGHTLSVTNSTASADLSYAEVFAALNSPRLRGPLLLTYGCLADCPAHDDQLGHSLRVTDGDDGVTFDCEAGCETEAIRDALFLLVDAPSPRRKRTVGRDCAVEQTALSFTGYRIAEEPVAVESRSAETPQEVKAVLEGKAYAPAPSPAQVSVNTGDSGDSEPVSEWVEYDTLTRRVEGLLEDFRAIKGGSTEPEWAVPLRYDLLAPNAAARRSGLENVGILMGLQLEHGDPTEPLILSRSLYARAMGWADPDGNGSCKARDHLQEFVRIGALRKTGELDVLKARGRSRGTFLYQPGDYDLIDLYEGRVGELTVVEAREEAA